MCPGLYEENQWRIVLPQPAREGSRVSFGPYLIGFVIMFVGIALGAFYLHVPAHWIGVLVLVLVGLGVLTGVTRTRRADP
jgi:hypothetical protein